LFSPFLEGQERAGMAEQLDIDALVALATSSIEQDIFDVR
jgi:hypothetical protein